MSWALWPITKNDRLIASSTNTHFYGHNNDMLLTTNLGRWHINCYEAGTTDKHLDYPLLAGYIQHF